MFFSFETFFSSLIKMTIIITYCANVEHFVHLGTRRRGSWSSEERRDSSRQSGPRWRPINQQNGGNEEVDEESPFSAEEREARAEVISFRRRPEVDIARARLTNSISDIFQGCFSLDFPCPAPVALETIRQCPCKSIDLFPWRCNVVFVMVPRV